MKTSRLFKRNEKGQSLVELGFGMVFVLVLLAGIVDLARASLFFIDIRDAVQEGALYGTLYPTFCDQIAARTQSMLEGSAVNPGPAQIKVTVDGVECHAATAVNACAGKQLEVTAAQPEFPLTMPFLGTILGRQTLDLHATVSNTILRPACH